MGPPRKSSTVTVRRSPVEAPPRPKSTPDSWTLSPAWVMDRVPARTVVVSCWLPSGISPPPVTVYARGPAPFSASQAPPS